MAERLFKDALKQAFEKILGKSLTGKSRTDADVADDFVENYDAEAGAKALAEAVAFQGVFEKLIGGPLVGTFENVIEVTEAVVDHYETDVVLTVTVTDGTSPIAEPTIVISQKGVAVDAELDGTYILQKGIYDFSVSKATYDTVTGYIEIGYDEVIAEEADLDVVMTLS